MTKRRLIALILAVCAILTLCACSQTHLEAYNTAAAMDFEGAWRKYSPDDVVCYISGEKVTWQEFFYQIRYFAQLISAADGVTITSWDQPSKSYTDADGHGLSYGALVMQNAVNTIVQYHALHSGLTAAGAVLGKEALDSVEAARQSAISQSFGGDEAAFLEYLDSMYCTDALWTWYNQVDALYAFDGFDTLYGVNGAEFSDEAVMAYAAGDENGAWTEYVQIKQIYLYDEAETAAGEDAATDEPEEQSIASRVEAVTAALDAGDSFDDVYAAYNENPSLDAFPDGRCVYADDVPEAVYNAALEMEEGAYAAVETESGFVFLQKLPIDPDCGVYYDEENDVMYTLRYCAAWQAYADRINGENGWIATATREWTDEFGDMSLKTLFE